MSDESQEIRKLAAIMFTDMVGYSALAQKNESMAIDMLEEHRGLLRPLFPKYGGREIETVGDAFFVEFGSAVEAVRCAVDMQHVLYERNKAYPPDRHIKIRIGIHLGDVIQKGNHVLGDGVNIAARLEPLAPPEGIAISEDVARQVQNKLDIPLNKLGQRNLKNIQFPMEIYSVNLPWQPTAEPIAPTTSSAHAQAKSDETRTGRANPMLWYSLAGVGVVGAAVLYFVLDDQPTVPSEQNVPTIVRETVRVKEPTQAARHDKTETTPTLKPSETRSSDQPKSTPEPSKKKIAVHEETKPTEPPPLLVNADSILQLGMQRYRAGDLSGAKATFTEALHHFQTAKNKSGEADALLATARVLKHQDELLEAENKAREAATLFKSLDNAAGVARSQVMLADVLIEQGKAKEAESVAGLVVLALPASDEAFVARALLAKAHAALDNMEDALKQAQYCDENRQRTPDMEWNAFVVATVVRIRAMANVLDRTKRQRQNFESEIQRSGHVPAQMEGRLAYGEVAMTLGMNPAIGRQRLTALNNDATAKGFRLIARKARERLRN
jgi:class 3 adenylate cyclase